MATILGIDPGITGAAALIEASTGDGLTRWRLLASDDDVRAAAATADLVVIEAQHASPQMGVSSAFKLGRSFGIALGLTRGANVVLPQPAVWRRAFGLGSKADGLVMIDESLFDVPKTMTHDEADAILLAWWGWRTVLSGNAPSAVPPSF